jgi:hypothetical protein
MWLVILSCSFQYSLFCMFSNLIMICLGCLFLVLIVWCSISFLYLNEPLSQLEKFSIIILYNRLSMPLFCISSLFSITMIHKFSLFMISQMSFMFHSYFLSIFSWSFVVDIIPLLCLLFFLLHFQIVPLCSPRFWLGYLFGIFNSLFQIDYFSGFPYLYWFPLIYPTWTS